MFDTDSVIGPFFRGHMTCAGSAMIGRGIKGINYTAGAAAADLS